MYVREHERYEDVMGRNVGHWIDDDGTFIPNLQATTDGQFTTGHPYTSGMINGYGSYGNNMQPYIFHGESTNCCQQASLVCVRFSFILTFAPCACSLLYFKEIVRKHFLVCQNQLFAGVSEIARRRLRF